METAEKLMTENLDAWASTVKAKSSAGRGSSNKRELYGVRKLRELILEFAVRGMLVPQNSDEEPSAELLKRIAAQKAQLIDDGKIRKQPKQPPVEKEEFPFPLPPGWEFERIGNLTSKLGSGSTPRGGKSAYVPDGIIFLRSQNVWNDGLKLDDTAYIPEETHEAMSNTQVFPRDVLLNITGASLGRSTVFPENLVTANVSQHVTIIRLVEPEMAEFLHLGILSPLVQKLVWGRQVGMAIEGLSKKVLEKFEFPIPPLAEQHRIVAKVDELMALCDQLEQEQESSLDTHDTLVATLLGALTTATADASQFAEAWQRIQANFDTLFTTESSIDQFKKAATQLAAIGKYSSGKGCDDRQVSSGRRGKTSSGGKALEVAALEKEQLIEAGIAKKEKINPLVIDNPHSELPLGWYSCQLNDVIACLDHKRVPIKKSERTEGDVPYYGANGPVGSIGEKLFDEPLVLVVEDETFLGRKKPFSYFIDGPSWVNNHAHVLKCTSVILPKFLNIVLSYYPFIPLTSGTTGRKKLTKNTLLQIPINVAPVEDQFRIVAQVEELMALCDQLKASLATAQATQLNLADSLVEQAIG